jgi:hypothetical protein
MMAQREVHIRANCSQFLSRHINEGEKPLETWYLNSGESI